MIRDTYSPAVLETGITELTVIELPDRSCAIALPRDQQEEPLRSLHLLDAAALGPILVVTFSWDDDTGDDTIYLMPLDTRDLALDLSHDISVSTFIIRHVEHTLGGPRESWEAARSTPLSSRFAVVRPQTAS